MAIAGLLVTKSTYRLSPLTLGLLLISSMLKGGTAWKSDIKSNITILAISKQFIFTNQRPTVKIE